MYRVVLVDDETIIVEGLRRVVKWADYDCEVVGTAGDAAEGAELIRQLRPHILFTDIRMPGEDGLSMLAALRSEFPRYAGYRADGLPGFYLCPGGYPAGCDPVPAETLQDG